MPMEKYTKPKAIIIKADDIDILTSSGIDLPEIPISNGGIDLPEIPLNNKMPSY